MLSGGAACPSEADHAPRRRKQHREDDASRECYQRTGSRALVPTQRAHPRLQRRTVLDGVLPRHCSIQARSRRPHHEVPSRLWDGAPEQRTAPAPRSRPPSPNTGHSQLSSLGVTNSPSRESTPSLNSVGVRGKEPGWRSRATRRKSSFHLTVPPFFSDLGFNREAAVIRHPQIVPIFDYIGRWRSATGRKEDVLDDLLFPPLSALIPAAPLRAKPRRTYDPIRETATPEGTARPHADDAAPPLGESAMEGAAG